jgi:hypothetical protein
VIVRTQFRTEMISHRSFTASRNIRHCGPSEVTTATLKGLHLYSLEYGR